MRARRPRFRRAEGLAEGAAVAARERIEYVLIGLEVEHHVHAFAFVAEVAHVVPGLDVRFRENDRVALPPLQELAEVAQHVELLAWLLHRRTLRRDDEGNGVHAKAGHAELDPEAHDLQNFSLYVRVGRVEIRLKFVEAMKVVLAGDWIPRPGLLLHTWKDHPLVRARRSLPGPDIPIAITAVRVAAGLLEPGMLVRRVIDDEVDEHTNAALLRRMCEFDEITERAIARIDIVVIADVVAVVLLGRRLERHEPDRRDTEPAEVVEATHQPLEIADTIAVGVHERRDRQAIDDRVLVPEIVDHDLSRPREPAGEPERTSFVPTSGSARARGPERAGDLGIMNVTVS